MGCPDTITPPRTADTGGAAVGDDGAETGSVFAELVCAEPEWLEREFTALIAANFPPSDPDETPHRIAPHRPAAAATADHPPHDRPEPAAPRPRRREHTCPHHPARERSPPRNRAGARARSRSARNSAEER